MSLFRFRNEWFRRIGLWSVTFLALLATGTASGQGIVGDSGLERSGLRSFWFTSAELGASGRIVDWSLNVNRSEMTTYIRVSRKGFSEFHSEKDLDAFGKPYGLDRLVEFAEFRKSILEKEISVRGGKDKVELEQYSLPKSTIFVLGSNSIATSIDADTGRINWTARIGDGDKPVIGIGADDEHVAVVESTRVHCLEAKTGRKLWSHHLKFAAAASPVVAGGKFFVPLLNGQLEVFRIHEQGFGSFPVIARGIPTARPLVAGNTVSWPTNIGHLNFTTIDGKYENSLIYRLKADGPIESTPTLKGNLIFSSCADGFIYAIEEGTGRLSWQASIGAAASTSPFVLDDSVYIISDDGRLFSLDANEGTFRWKQPTSGVGKYLGKSSNRIYLTDKVSSLLVVDPDSGQVISRSDLGSVDYVLQNRDTDRLYIASRSGLIQCIHEVSRVKPYFHPQEIVKAVRKPGKRSTENPFMSGDESGAEDPFKEGEDSTTEDPFAAEPTGGNMEGDGGRNNASEDPFSGGASTDSGDDQPPTPEPSAKPPVKKAVVWKDVSKIFQSNCSKCHSTNGAKGGFDVSSFETVMSHGAELVSPGDGASSKLYKLMTHEEQPAMPPGGKKIPGGDLKKIKAWIDGGALENPAEETPAPAEGSDQDPDPFGG